MFRIANGQQALVAYTARERFGPSSGKKWDSYIEWSKLSHLTELLSLDGLLCPSFPEEPADEDWSHNVQEDFKLDYYWDLPYLLKRVEGRPDLNILAVICEPETDAPALFQDPRFEFLGYDLSELETGVSALTNCGGFAETFSPSDLSSVGLLPKFEKAREIQKLLVQNNPEEPHADCDLWAIWRMTALDSRA